MELLRQTWSNLGANKLRSFLTMFGIMWGVISIVLLSAVGEGFQRGNQHVLEELGKNIVIIRNGRTSLQAGGARAGPPGPPRRSTTFACCRRSRSCSSDVSPELMRGGDPGEERLQRQLAADERRLARLPGRSGRSRWTAAA